MHANFSMTMSRKRACVSDDAYIAGSSALGLRIPLT
jgi:hypothetical protein